MTGWGSTVEGKGRRRKPTFFELPVMQQVFNRVSQQLFVGIVVIPVLWIGKWAQRG